jgi:hypothetical protein
MKKIWEEFENDYEATDLEQDAFEKAYRKSQFLEWHPPMLSVKCDDAVLALLTYLNEEITVQERERRLRSLTHREVVRAFKTKSNSTLWTVNWSYDEIPDDLPGEIWDDWVDRFEENRQRLSGLPEMCLKAQRMRLFEWIRDQKAQITEKSQEIRQLTSGVAKQRTLRDSLRREHVCASSNLKVAKGMLASFRNLHQQKKAMHREKQRRTRDQGHKLPESRMWNSRKALY